MKIEHHFPAKKTKQQTQNKRDPPKPGHRFHGWKQLPSSSMIFSNKTLQKKKHTVRIYI